MSKQDLYCGQWNAYNSKGPNKATVVVVDTRAKEIVGDVSEMLHSILVAEGQGVLRSLEAAAAVIRYCQGHCRMPIRVAFA